MTKREFSSFRFAFCFGSKREEIIYCIRLGSDSAEVLAVVLALLKLTSNLLFSCLYLQF